MRTLRWWIVGLVVVALAGCSKSSEPQPAEHALVEAESAHLDHMHPNLVLLNTPQKIAGAFDGGTARYERDEPFRQVGFFYTADPSMADTNADTKQAFEYRVRLTDGQWSAWAPIEVTWYEDGIHVGRVLLDEEAGELEIRRAAGLDWLQVEFYEEIAARPGVLARDLPVEQPSERVQNGDYVTVQQKAIPSYVVTRSQWGARNPSKVCGSSHDPYRQAIHHTYSPRTDGDIHATMRGIQAYHIDSNGWCDIGYHFVVSQAGKVYQGRSREDRTGAHVGGQNSGNIGTCFIGDFTSQTPSDAQINAAAQIVGWVGRTYGIPFNRTSIKGHREHAGQSTSCPGDNLLAELGTLVSRAENGGTPADYDVSVKVNWLGTDNFYDQGASASLADALPGDTFQAEILITNKSDEVIRNVWAGYLVEEPYLEATNYAIYSDHPSYDQSSWTINSADSDEDNPAKDALGAEGKLDMHAFSPGETKRVLIDMKANRYSVGAIEHPDVRGWIQHAESPTGTIFGDRDSWDDGVETNELGHEARAHAQMDVLDPNAWLFDDTSDEGNLEGWTGKPAEHFEQLKVNTNYGLLSQKISGEDARIISPGWTNVPAEEFDQLVLRVRSHDGVHTKAVFWAREGESFSEERAVRFEAAGDGEYHDLVIPLGEHTEWSGAVTQLRIDLLDGEAPGAEASGWYDVDSIFFQSSVAQTTSAPGVDFVDAAPVALQTDGGGNGDPDAGGTDNDAGGDPLTDEDNENLTVNDGCSATGSGNVPVGAAWVILAAFLGFTRRRDAV
ncbi:N-acetylmuramoyl-L-alanine amidase [Persicimonas caeni]|nr:N-acetylmuramoyl-L-alanine amidase [Persicimonas caeni]